MHKSCKRAKNVAQKPSCQNHQNNPTSRRLHVSIRLYASLYVPIRPYVPASHVNLGGCSTKGVSLLLVTQRPVRVRGQHSHDMSPPVLAQRPLHPQSACSAAHRAHTRAATMGGERQEPATWPHHRGCESAWGFEQVPSSCKEKVQANPNNEGWGELEPHHISPCSTPTARRTPMSLQDGVPLQGLPFKQDFSKTTCAQLRVDCAIWVTNRKNMTILKSRAV